MADSVLEVSDLSVRYGSGKWGLRHFSVVIGAGETVGLMGDSGCGKSTAAWAVLGLLPKSAAVSGVIRLCGQDFSPSMRGRAVSMAPQEPASSLNPVLKIGRQMQQAGGGQTRAAVLQMLAKLGLPNELMDEYPHQLSGGQVQRVVLGQALLCRPKLLIADEPGAALDSDTRKQVIELLKEQQRELKFGLLLITHQAEMLQGWANRTIQLSPREIPSGIRPAKESADWVLRVRGLCKAFPRVQALKDVDLEVNANGRLLITGASGSGKSTLARCMAGWLKQDGGTVEFRGSGNPQLIPQEPGDSLNPFWEAWEVVAESLRLKGVNQAQRKERALLWMQRVRLPAEMAGRKSGNCSGGERARLAIARALLACDCEGKKPALLIFDESFSGLNLELRAQILDLLGELQEMWPLSYIVVAHDEWLARAFGGRQVVMKQGRLTA